MGERPQVKKHAETHKIIMLKSTTSRVEKWIEGVWKIKNNLEKYVEILFGFF